MRDHEHVLASIESSARVVASLSTSAATIESMAKSVVDTLRTGGTILTCGHGGSAAEALHMSEELLGRFRADRRPLPAVSLVADPTLLTCIANDYGFGAVFERQVEGLGAEGDALVLFSTSGQGDGLLRAADMARRKGVATLALLGKGGGPLAARVDQALVVESADTARVQEAHQVAMHIILEAVERAFA